MERRLKYMPKRNVQMSRGMRRAAGSQDDASRVVWSQRWLVRVGYPSHTSSKLVLGVGWVLAVAGCWDVGIPISGTKRGLSLVPIRMKHVQQAAQDVGSSNEGIFARTCNRLPQYKATEASARAASFEERASCSLSTKLRHQHGRCQARCTAAKLAGLTFSTLVSLTKLIAYLQ